jgi:PDZ domain-containing protein
LKRLSLLAAGLLVAWLAVESVAIARQADRYYTVSPGSAPIVSSSSSCPTTGRTSLTLPDGRPCVRLVLPPGRAAPTDGSVMMVDVLVGRTSFGQMLLDKLGLLSALEPGSRLEPARVVLGSTPASQMACQGSQDMSAATSDAAVVALRRLGYSVSERDDGAVVYQVQSASAAARAGVHCGDLIVALDGTPVRSASALASLIHAHRPGDKVSLGLVRGGRHLNVVATLGSAPAGQGTTGQAFLGVVSYTKVVFDFPFPVSIDVGDIGGPSAGLALTLGLLDSLSGGHLTGGYRVAATGTISLDGTVGAIGDAAQKAIAVLRAGAQIFFVPTANYRSALSQAGSMKVVAVSSLSQALAYLRALGGQVPAAHTSR